MVWCVDEVEWFIKTRCAPLDGTIISYNKVWTFKPRSAALSPKNGQDSKPRDPTSFTS